jgi:hypothetical protein
MIAYLNSWHLNRTITATNREGKLTFTFLSHSRTYPGWEAGLRCVPAGTAARLGTGAETPTVFGARLHPNSVREKLTVTLDGPA